MPYQLIYRSKVARHVRFADAEQIAKRASQNNANANISGLLLYTPTHFVQLLEGEKSTVKATFDRIARDERHTEVQVIGECDVDERAFGGWGMRAVLPRQDTSSQVLERLDRVSALELLRNAR